MNGKVYRMKQSKLILTGFAALLVATCVFVFTACEVPSFQGVGEVDTPGDDAGGELVLPPPFSVFLSADRSVLIRGDAEAGNAILEVAASAEATFEWSVNPPGFLEIDPQDLSVTRRSTTGTLAIASILEDPGVRGTDMEVEVVATEQLVCPACTTEDANALDENGEVLVDGNNVLLRCDAGGNPVTDVDGNPVDEHGNLETDDDGNPVDEDGNRITDDDGNPVTDEDGNPLIAVIGAMDEHGDPVRCPGESVSETLTLELRRPEGPLTVTLAPDESLSLTPGGTMTLTATITGGLSFDPDPEHCGDSGGISPPSNGDDPYCVSWTRSPAVGEFVPLELEPDPDDAARTLAKADFTAPIATEDVVFTVTVLDAAGNQATGSVSATIASRLDLTVTLASTSIGAQPGGTIELEASIIGGTPPYNVCYLIDVEAEEDGGTIGEGDPQCQDPSEQIVIGTDTFANCTCDLGDPATFGEQFLVDTRDYTAPLAEAVIPIRVAVTDAVGAQVTDLLTLEVSSEQIGDQGGPVTLTSVTVDIPSLCPGGTTTISATADGGTGDYTFSFELTGDPQGDEAITGLDASGGTAVYHAPGEAHVADGNLVRSIRVIVNETGGSSDQRTGLVTTIDPATCDDGNGCTDDSCASGACLQVNNTATCDDGNECTSGDTCGGGTCVSGAQIACDDGNQCTNDFCESGVGCQHLFNNNPCDDGSACTVGDACSEGSCTGGPATNCDDGNPCTDDDCASGSGCTHTNNTANCDDEDPCTLTDVCSDGLCAGTLIDCSEQPEDNLCTIDTCVGGACIHTDIEDDTDCDDSLFCTDNDRCLDGVCINDGPPCAEGLVCDEDINECVTCTSDADCDDGNDCTDDTCDTDTDLCVQTAVVDGTVCDDGLFCSNPDECLVGECVSAGDFCPGACDEENDACVNCLKDNDCSDPTPFCVDDACVECRDSVDCTNPEPFCDQEGACVECLINADCDDARSCTFDFCDEAECNNLPVDSDCANGQFCDGVERCDPADTQADPASGCVDGLNPCSNPDLPVCDEANDVCIECDDDGDCDDGDLCTDDACDPGNGQCTHIDNTAPCDDGDACTMTDACSDGVCVPGTLLDCDDDNPCTSDFCDNGDCLHGVNDGDDCNDGLNCTPGPDICSGGVCAGTECPDPDLPVCDPDSDTCVECVDANDCSDGVTCTDDTCDANNTCVFEDSCPDNQFCDGEEFCDQDTGCQPGADPCDDGVGCTDDSCNEGQEECTNTPNNGLCEPGEVCDPILDCVECLEDADCDDAAACTVDACTGGVCEHPLDDQAPACGILLDPDPVGEGSSGNMATVPKEPTATFTWTLTNAVCDFGCDTEAIFYTVTGSAGEQVHIEVSVELGGACSCTDFADVDIVP